MRLECSKCGYIEPYNHDGEILSCDCDNSPAVKTSEILRRIDELNREKRERSKKDNNESV